MAPDASCADGLVASVDPPSTYHKTPPSSPAMPKILPLPFKIVFICLEPLATFAGAYSAFVSPEWYLASQIPGPTITGLLHTNETNMAIRLYGVLLALLAMISLAIFPVIASRSDALSFSIARRFIFVLAGMNLDLFNRVDG